MGQQGLSKWRRITSQHKRVGLDSMCFLYQFSRHPTYSPLTNILFEDIENGAYTAVTSTVTVVETFVHIERTGDTLLTAEYEKFFQGLPHFSIIPVDWNLARLAAKLRATYSILRTPDALQIAAALLEDCKVFVTNDRRLAKVRELTILILEDYV